MKTAVLWQFLRYVHLVSGLSHITSDLSNQELTTVPPNLRNDITKLVLARNLWITLNKDSFSNYPQLVYLDLQYNDMEVIEDGTFDRQIQLLYLLLSRNRIRQLPTYFGPSTQTLVSWIMYDGYTTSKIFQFPYFAAFSSLKKLLFGGVNIEMFPNASILPSTLTFCRVSNAILSTLPDLKYIPNVETLGYIKGNLQHIPQKHINTLVKLKKLRFDTNQLTRMPNLSHMTLLRELFLYSNQMREVPRRHISGLVSLEIMRLENNMLLTMPNVSYLTKLMDVDLSNNYITDVPANTLLGIPNLLTLRLNQNKISVLGDISALWAHVYLEDNNLTTLPDLYNMRLDTLMMEGNPLSCNQTLCWLRMWPWNKTLPIMDNPNCINPSKDSLSVAIQVHPAELQCFKGTAMVKTNW